MDGQREHHDFAVCREGTYDKAIEGIRMALDRGFRVTTNTTLFEGADPQSVRQFFDDMMDLGVEGMMLSPGYTYDKAPDQEHFLSKKKTRNLFRQILSNRAEKWRFNLSPLFLEFLMGKREYKCTPWGMPTYNIFGWQKPCYLLQDGYADTFDELLRETEWSRYGTESGNPKCANCMVHSGYEASAVNDTFSSLGGFAATVRATLFNKYKDPDAMGGATSAPPSRSGQLVQIAAPAKAVSVLSQRSIPRPRAKSTQYTFVSAARRRRTSRLRPRESRRLDSLDGHRTRNPRGPRKGVRLSRRHHHHPERRPRHRRLRLRPQIERPVARRLRDPRDAEKRAGQALDCL